MSKKQSTKITAGLVIGVIFAVIDALAIGGAVLQYLRASNYDLFLVLVVFASLGLWAYVTYARKNIAKSQPSTESIHEENRGSN